MNPCKLLYFAALLSCLPPLKATAADSPAANIAISYTLPRDGRISLLVRNAEGKVVRELLHAAPRKKGANTENWDGLDEQRQPAPAGTYSWKLLSTQGLKAEYLTTLGTNPKTPWETWPGNHNALLGVAADESGIYFGGPGEGTPVLVKYGWDEKRLWSIDAWLEAWAGPQAMIVAGGKSIHAQGAKAQTVDAATGKYLGGWNIGYPGVDYSKVTHWMGTASVLDIAGRGDFFVASYANKDAVRWISPADGKTVDEAAVPGPTGIAVDKTGKIFTISNGAVTALTRENKVPTTVVAANLLQGPWRLDIDPTTGDILVLESGLFGESTQQVKRFSPVGKLLAAYGKKGGRTLGGKYEPNGFANANDITALPDGGFIVCEPWSAPRRTIRMDKNGVITREWYGGQMYANYAATDPDDPTLVWMDSNWGWLTQVKVDYEKKTWKILANYQFQGVADGLVGGTVHGGGRWEVRRHNSQTYLARQDTPCVLRVDEAKGVLVPLVVSREQLAVPWNRDPWGGLPQWVRDMVGNDPKTPMHSFFWIDTNADGKPQKEEMNLSTYGAWWGSFTTDKDLNYYASGTDATGKPSIMKIPVERWTPEGVPVYATWGKHIKQAEFPAEMRGGALLPLPAGGFFAAANTNDDKKFGQGFWGARTGGNRVARFDNAGKLLWTVGHHGADSQNKPGEGRYFWRIVGTAHDCVVVGDVEIVGHVWDKDGLWVGRLLEDPDLAAAPAQAYAMGTENFGGSLYENAATGNVIYFGGGANNTPVYRIRGWDQFERQNGQVVVTPEQAAKTTKVAVYEATREDVLRIGGIPGIKLDGDLTEWKNLKPITIKDGDEVVATVRVANANGMIYAAWDVNTTTPWQNAATEQLAFQGGASVALSLGTWDPAPTREARPGDVRIVVAPIGGKNKVLLYFPKVAPGQAKGSGPIYETGNGRLQLEGFQNRTDPRINQAFVKPKVDGEGYTVEMSVAHWVTGLQIQPGQKLRVDASVQLANAEGNHVAARIPWHSRDASDMANNDVYTEAVLRPWNWGEARVE